MVNRRSLEKLWAIRSCESYDDNAKEVDCSNGRLGWISMDRKESRLLYFYGRLSDNIVVFGVLATGTFSE